MCGEMGELCTVCGCAATMGREKFSEVDVLIKLFACDLDGTLFNALHTTDPIILGAVRAVLDSGAHFTIATGRFMHTNAQFGFEGLPIEAVCGNGSLVYSHEGELIRHVSLDHAFVEELLRAFPQVYFDCIGTDHVYTNQSADAREGSFRHRHPFRAILTRGMRRTKDNAGEWVCDQSLADMLAHDVVKVNARVDDPGIRAELDAFLAERADTAVNAPFSSVMYEITGVGVNKGEAVAWLADYLGIGQDQVAVYGDGGNDVAMLARYAHYGHAYAPREACDDALAAASEVIGSYVWHAVPRHMRRTVAGR